MERRNFVQTLLALLGSAALAVFALGAAVMQGIGTVLQGKGKNHGWIEIGALDSLPTDRPMERTISFPVRDGWQDKTERQNIFILFKDGTPTVYSSACPHLDCPVSLIADEAKFVCKCHMTYFDSLGEVTEGPSPRGLDPLPSKVEEGILYCRWVRYRSGGTERVEI